MDDRQTNTLLEVQPCAVRVPDELLCKFLLFLVCLFVVVKSENLHFASRPGLEQGVKPLRVYPLGPRSSSCCPTKSTPPPGDTLRAN